MKLPSRMIFPLSLLLLLSICGTANATTYFFNNTTINSSYSGEGVIGYTNAADLANKTNGLSSIVELVTGGSISGNAAIYNNSTLDVSGGSVAGNLSSNDTGTINYTGGSSNALVAYNNSIVNLSGGSTVSDVDAFNTSIVNVSGGSIGGALISADASTLNYTGGSAALKLLVFNNSTFNIFGTGLAADLVSASTSYETYTLSGKLEDGTDITGQSLLIIDPTKGKFTLNDVAPVPELSTLLGLGCFTALGGLAVFRQSRLFRKAV